MKLVWRGTRCSVSAGFVQLPQALVSVIVHNAPHIENEILRKLELAQLGGLTDSVAHLQYIGALAHQIPNAQRQIVVVEAQVLLEHFVNALNQLLVRSFLLNTKINNRSVKWILPEPWALLSFRSSTRSWPMSLALRPTSFRLVFQTTGPQAMSSRRRQLASFQSPRRK